MRLIDADANIETMKKCAENPEDKYALLCYRYAQMVLEEAPTVEPVPPWHRVEDELPEPIHPTDTRYKAYLICDSLGYMHVADYTYSKHFPTCYSFHVNGEEVTDVKYWMPIEPPKEE